MQSSPGLMVRARQRLPVSIWQSTRKSFISSMRDLIASGLSPLRPELAAVSAGGLLLTEIDRLVAARASFAFESTLSGLTYVRRFEYLKRVGYDIELVYLQLTSPALALRRIASRVKQGGHHVPAADVRRRFKHSWDIFRECTNRWRTHGRCTTIRVSHLDSWSKAHDSG